MNVDVTRGKGLRLEATTGVERFAIKTLFKAGDTLAVAFSEPAGGNLCLFLEPIALQEEPGITTAPEVPAGTENSTAILDRDTIKEELTALGVAFNHRCKTPTLATMLAEAKESIASPMPAPPMSAPPMPASPVPAPAVPAPAVPAPSVPDATSLFGNEELAPPPPPPSLEEVLTAAKAYAARQTGGAGIKAVETICEQLGAVVEEVTPDGSKRFVPKISAISEADRAKAIQLFEANA